MKKVLLYQLRFKSRRMRFYLKNSFQMMFWHLTKRSGKPDTTN